MKLKILAAAPLLAACMLNSQLAIASTAATMSVGGTITAQSCDVSVDQNVLLGDIQYSSLNTTGMTDLPEQRVMLSILCEASMLIAWSYVDNREGSTSPELPDAQNAFGLGYDTKGNSLGGYSVFQPNGATSTDRGNSYLTASKDSGKTWATAGGSMSYVKGSWLASADNSGETAAAPEYFQTLSTPLVIRPKISSIANLDLSREANLDGSLTIQLYYL